jgi:hypothetical protein
MGGGGLLAHGGTAGLILELSGVLALVLLGVVVWWRSRDAEDGESGPRDEAAVEQERR